MITPLLAVAWSARPYSVATKSRSSAGNPGSDARVSGKVVYIVGTCDTKAEELCFARSLVLACGVAAALVDVSTRPGPDHLADISAADVAAMHPEGANAVLNQTDRGTAITAMGEALAAWLLKRGDIGCVLGLGGSGNSALVTRAMRALPVGVPKLMVSTIASGNIAAYVGPGDIAMMNAVADIAGLNAITRRVIANAAHAAAGMALWQAPPAAPEKPGVGLSMFGVTTTLVTLLRDRLAATHTPYVFHATGSGGRAMEKLLDSDLLQALLDVTTTEVADYLCGGIFPCDEDRFGAPARTGRPWVGSLGAVDMVNFGGRDTVPPQHAHRLLLAHNPQVTLMRTSAEENAAVGGWIAHRLNRCEGPVRLVLPLGGVSALDAPGQPFHDPAADGALFTAIRSEFRPGPMRRLIEAPHHINDAAFADTLIHHFREVAG